MHIFSSVIATNSTMCLEFALVLSQDSYQQKDQNTFFFFLNSQTIQRALSMCTQSGKPTFSRQYSVDWERIANSWTTNQTLMNYRSHVSSPTHRLSLFKISRAAPGEKKLDPLSSIFLSVCVKSFCGPSIFNFRQDPQEWSFLVKTSRSTNAPFSLEGEAHCGKETGWLRGRLICFPQTVLDHHVV